MPHGVSGTEFRVTARGLDTRRDKEGRVRMLSFIKTEVNVSREVGTLDESLDGNQKS